VDRKRVGLLYGGRSGEHEVSVRSARSVAAEIDRDRYELMPIGVGRDGRWYWIGAGDLPTAEAVHPAQGPEVLPARGGASTCRILDADHGSEVAEFDVVFPVLHGPHGEDGTLQGLCEVLGVPCVGAGVIGSALGMDKDVHKRLLREAGVPVVPFEVVRVEQWRSAPDAVGERLARLGSAVFVKPANLGSSVGISKVRDRAQLDAALETAFRYDRKAVVERAIDAREIECAVLGNDAPRASAPGEIVPGDEFYSYDDKYAAASTAALLIPAPLTDGQQRRVRDLALRAFQVLELRGMARIDFFLDRSSGELYVNEPNTLPGFTSISMYPKLWQESGVPYRDLISELIELAIAEYANRPAG
jgi:D-alanine-D-alanine ligase